MTRKKAPTTVQATSTTGEVVSLPVGNNIRRLRRERKWTQWQLAQISRLSERTIQRIESGCRMGITAELAFANAFEVEIPALYTSAPSGKGGAAKPDRVKRFQALKRLVSGAALLDVIETVPQRINANHSELEDEQRRAVADFCQYMHVWTAVWREVEPSERGRACQVFQTKLDELDACGVYVFGGRLSKPRPDETNRQEGMLVFKRADDPQIIQPRLLQQFGKAMCLITVPVDR